MKLPQVLPLAVLLLLLLLMVTVVPSAANDSSASRPPNIIFILADDVGWGDLEFNGGSIGTPTLNKLSGDGVIMKEHHAHSTCTPSRCVCVCVSITPSSPRFTLARLSLRASLMTGRYSANTGLNFPLLPGSLGGIPRDMPTMPEVLAEQGYACHMVGKWHVGNAQWRQTPVGRGFQTHVGSYMWSMEVCNRTAQGPNPCVVPVLSMCDPLPPSPVSTTRSKCGSCPGNTLPLTGCELMPMVRTVVTSHNPPKAHALLPRVAHHQGLTSTTLSQGTRQQH